LAAARALARFLIALNDAFDPLRDGVVIVRPVRLAMLPPQRRQPPDRFYFLSGVDPNHSGVRAIAAIFQIIARL
jgi:hypothetical protein